MSHLLKIFIKYFSDNDYEFALLELKCYFIYMWGIFMFFLSLILLYFSTHLTKGKNMKKNFCLGAAVLFGCSVCFLSGCVSAPPPKPSPEIDLDANPLKGGISSADIRTVASQMCPSILAVPEISGTPDLVRIKIAGFTNKSRFFINSDLFMKRLTAELNRYGRNKVRFLNNNARVQANRHAVLKDRQSEMIMTNLKNIAAEMAASPVAKQAKPIKVAVIPVLNTNLVNMNADSFAAMLRAEVVNAAGGKIQFLMPGVTEGADYYLTGQFIPETMKTEGIINLANYIEVVDARVKAGKSMYIASEAPNAMNPTQINTVQTGANSSVTTVTPASKNLVVYENHLKQILNDPAMRANPNVNKRLNVMLVDAKNKVSVFEKMILLDRKFSDNSGAAKYIISGEINGMHQRRNGTNVDYLLITMQLTDPESNETIWEDIYEVKRLTDGGIVYK
ncbi:MAG: hypothetical protein E7039_06175 [Lentisphaerae bacterium]|nr:hypothetical protein [Lentisphaerota bacterium]